MIFSICHKHKSLTVKIVKQRNTKFGRIDSTFQLVFTWIASSTFPFLAAFSAWRCKKWARLSIVDNKRLKNNAGRLKLTSTYITTRRKLDCYNNVTSKSVYFFLNWWEVETCQMLFNEVLAHGEEGKRGHLPPLAGKNSLPFEFFERKYCSMF